MCLKELTADYKISRPTYRANDIETKRGHVV